MASDSTNRTELASSILAGADVLYSAAETEAALARIAQAVSETLGREFPLVLAVMGGAVVFSGRLLPLLRFPLEFDYIHVTRYRERTAGGGIDWRVEPKEDVHGRAVLVLDDILDEGATMAAVLDKLRALGAKSVHSAVFADKRIGRPKPVRADFVGVEVPDRYVFGFGMDAYGLWRNLPEIYALNETN
jgi:hypoxanthine phosphoribosyltransferase